jgi:hypothetical protein
MLLVLCLSFLLTSVNCIKDGHFVKKLDEYYSTIKCVANIVEDLIPGI